MKALVVFFLLFFTPQSFSQTKLVPKPGSAVVGAGGGGGGGGLANPVANNTWLQWLNDSASAVNILRLNDSNILQFNRSTTPLQIESSSATINSDGDININSQQKIVFSAVDSLVELSPGTSSTELRFYDDDADFYTGIKAAGTTTSSVTYSLPPTLGSAGQVLTDAAGDGILSWETPSASPTFPLLGSNGSASAPTYSFSSSTGTGMFLISGELHFARAGADRIAIDTNGLRPVASGLELLGDSGRPWDSVYANIYSAQAGLRVHSSSFGTGSFILAKGLPSPSGATIDGFWGESGATNSYGFTAGSDVSSGSAAKGIYIEAQNNTSTGAGGIVSIRGGNSTSGDGGGIRFITPGTKPTCASGIRGMYWHTLGGAGVKDSVEVCVKNNADAYIWHSIY